MNIERAKKALINADAAGDTEAAKQLANYIKSQAAPPQEAPQEAPQKNGLFDRIGERFAERDAALWRASETPNFPGGEAGLVYNIAGQTLQKGLNDVPSEIITSVVQNTPQGVKDFGSRVYSDFKSRPVGAIATAPLSAAGYVLGEAAEGYDKFKRNYPTAGLYADSTLGFGNALLATMPVKGQSIPSRSVEAGQQAVKTVEKAGRQVAKPFVKYAPDISPEALREAGGKMIGSASKSGAIIKQEAAAGFIDDITQKIKPKSQWAKAAVVRDQADDIIDSLAALKGQPMGLDDAMELESTLGKLAYSPKNYVMGKFTPEGLKLKKIQESLADMVDNAADSGLLDGDPTAVANWREGQKYWAASVRAREIENIIENAQNFDQPASSIRVGMRNILKNKSKFNKYTKDQQLLIKDAAKTGIVTDLARIGASGLGPIAAGAMGGFAGFAAGGPIGSAIGTAAAGGASFAGREASKAIATSRQMAKAQKAYRSVAAESVGLPTKKLTLNQIMMLPPEQAKLYLKTVEKAK
jgi:hypothetical protein